MKKGYFYIVPIILQKIGCCIFFVLYKTFVHLEVAGREKLESLRGPVIFSANHTSELDVTALPLVLPFFSTLRPMYFVMKSRKKMKEFGWRNFLYGSGFLTLLGGCDIRSGYKNYAIALHTHLKLLRNDKSVCIFPEGKRTQDGLFGPAHGGLGYLAYVSRATVVPLAIDTFFNISWKEFWRGRRKVTLKIGEPVSVNEMFPSAMIKPSLQDFRHAAQMILDKSRQLMNPAI